MTTSRTRELTYTGWLKVIAIIDEKITIFFAKYRQQHIDIQSREFTYRQKVSRPRHIHRPFVEAQGKREFARNIQPFVCKLHAAVIIDIHELVFMG